MREIHYYSNYEDSYDIDCFFRIGNTPFHFASNGNPIPSFITRSNNIAIQDAVSEIIEYSDGEVYTWTETIRALIQRELVEVGGRLANDSVDNRGLEEMIEDYASSFIEMARIGFISMDLDEEGFFHIIASPKDQKIPNEIMVMLPVAKASDDIQLEFKGQIFLGDFFYIEETRGRRVNR